MNEGDPIPKVDVIARDGTSIALRSVAGPLVVYFYPKDDTPACTREARDFSDARAAFTDAGVRVIGVSRDPIEAHAKFAAKHDLNVELVSDVDGTACDAFGVWGEKTLYGRTYMGIERATFLFGGDGRLRRSWRKVRVPGHVAAVLDAVHQR